MAHYFEDPQMESQTLRACCQSYDQQLAEQELGRLSSTKI
jgi:hypothetical protein